jgi:hypothetical protein
MFDKRPVCRGFNYYVNPESNDITELGTQRYPYKYLGSVFVELINIHAHTNRTINVYIKEATNNYLWLSRNYIVNVTQVNFKSYSDTSNTPQKASMIMKESGLILQSPKTMFNILNNTDLKFDEFIMNHLDVSTHEK